MARHIIIKASEGHRTFGKLLKRVYHSDEHLIIERDGYPVAVIMSYQEYEQLSREQAVTPAGENLPPTLSLEEAFGSVEPVSQPEDFAVLREAAIEDHVQSTMQKMKNG